MVSQQNWPQVHGVPAIKGQLKSVDEDFFVDEIAAEKPSGEGKFLWLQVEKKSTNTDWMIREIAKSVEAKPEQIGYAGLKDRHAVTRQWISLPGFFEKKLEQQDEIAGFKILQRARHQQPLKPGMLKGNRFEIRVRQLSTAEDQPELKQSEIEQQLNLKLQKITAEGFANYFTEQRFGYENITNAKDFLEKDKPVAQSKQGFYFSVARSLIFNDYLAQRIQRQNWNQCIEADLLLEHETGKQKFAPEIARFAAAVAKGKLSPSGPMYGKGEPRAGGEAYALEKQVISLHSDLAMGLISYGLKMKRRSLRIFAQALSWSFEENDLLLQFELPAGCYATALIRELVDYRSAQQPNEQQPNDQPANNLS